MSKPPSWNQIRADAAAFAARWVHDTDEAAEAQTFWTEFLAIFGVDRKRVAVFEKRAQRLSTGGRGRIDLFWPGVLIAEHKSAGRNLDDAEQQALDYLDSIDQDDFPGLLVVCDFARIRVIDLGGDRVAYEFPLTELPVEIDRFAYLAGYSKRQLTQAHEHEVDVAAALLMGSLYEEVSDTGFSDHETSVFLVRMLFILFGDDTGLWEKSLFLEFLETRTQPDGSDLGSQLALLFQTLDRPEQRRARTLDELLARFPYVNGGLFADRLDIPSFDSHVRDVLIECCHIDWGSIVPAIFGSLFQAVKSKEDRRHLGEHYTSEDNIRKALGPLLLDDLKDQLAQSGHSVRKLRNLRKRLGRIQLLDPAAGCGNFLVIAYRELRQLELEILVRLRELTGQEQLALDSTLGLHVSLSQLHGIELEEWPARIAETALFLIDHQCNQILAREFGQAPDRLPISINADIRVGNALTMNWRDVCPIDGDTVIIGNPPYAGHKERDPQQSADMAHVWEGTNKAGVLDYVTCWFLLAARQVKGTGAQVAFVSTNSISQGRQPEILWKAMVEQGAHITFAYRSFPWENEAPGKAAVTCVIVGFSNQPPPSHQSGLPLFTWDGQEHKRTQVSQISPYLVEGPMIAVPSRRVPLSPNAPTASYGSMPIDNGHLVVSAEEADTLRNTDPVAAAHLRRYIGAKEMLHNELRYCLWFTDATPGTLKQSPFIKDRLTRVRDYRNTSTRAATRTLAATPALFGERRQPRRPYLAVAKVSSQKRKYLPAAIFTPDIIASGSLILIDHPEPLLPFAFITSSTMAAWNDLVSGRMKTDYQVSIEITLNNFPWPALRPQEEQSLIHSAEQVLDVRNRHENTTLADLYDPLFTPADLTAAHRTLDQAVLALFGLPRDADAESILAALFNRYAQHTGRSPGYGSSSV